MMLKLTVEQGKAFKELIAYGEDSALELIYSGRNRCGPHGSWTHLYAPLNNIDREALAVAVVTANYEVAKTKLERYQELYDVAEACTKNTNAYKQLVWNQAIMDVMKTVIEIERESEQCSY
ncbi:hypothetical protein [Bacillus amyloliquefaciens]|uniref:hypothetical protein n=1 Tax=Bacillus amyloliquefaciens TaxID=1390 RepID=UPI002DBDE6AA|nr:hypothetical protein [Bacillus amyloliquefaciens]MEC3841539.1 hypothetical protein [Bacillus amyloliquefaciens]